MRSVKHGRKRTRRRVNYSKNLVVARKKAVKKRKSMHGTPSKLLRMAWNKKATAKQNMEVMGLAYDANKLFPLCSTTCNESEDMEIGELSTSGDVKSQLNEVLKNKSLKKGATKISEVAAALEAEAREKEEKQKKGRSYHLLPQDIEFCVYMIERHGDDYKGMSRDGRNIYQDTAKQIERKVRIFKQSSNYSKYLELKSQAAA